VRNQEAARYARWSAIAAGLIALLVIGIYAERAISAARRRRATPAVVPAAVQQQTETFSYKRVEKDRTIFAIRASRATQFREDNRALLEDVWITIYGRDGTRNDNIHARECGYDQKTGSVQCQGEVTIEVQGANRAANQPAQKSLEVKTSNLSFDGQTGEASTPSPVDFLLPQGHGRGVGVSYTTQTAVVRIEHAVEFELIPSQRTGGAPVTIKGSSLEVRRNDRLITLGGPAIVRQGERELLADRMSVDLDDNFRASRVVAEGHPAIRNSQAGQQFEVAADIFEGFLSPAGWVQRAAAIGNVAGMRQTPGGADRFSSSRVDVSFEPQRNILREMTANGSVTAQSEQGGVSQVLKTSALRVKFAAGERADSQRIESAETLAPATIESKTGAETTELSAPKFTAVFAQRGRLDSLVGTGGVEVRRQAGNSTTQVSTSENLKAAFAQDGQWETVEETGHVHFQQADRQASASFAKMDRAKDEILLSGSPILTDAMSRTTARTVTIGQKSGEIDARGGVVSTYLPSGHGASVNMGSGPANITADTLAGSISSGRVVYAGHARLWQGESVLDADQITVWRDEKKMQAAGNVVAVFAQTSGPALRPAARPASSPSQPALWRVQAPSLTFWNEQGKARLEGGVIATSQQAALESRTLDVYLSSASAPESSGPPAGKSRAAPAGGQLNRAVALGSVVVRQGDRRGTADRAEYTSADEKFVLSGGQPTLTDASGNTTSGHSLTFFVANDTILIDSQEGSRTLTKHRVEK